MRGAAPQKMEEGLMFGNKNEKKLDKYSIKLLENFRGLQYTDIIGIGNILSVKEEDDFDDYLTAIIGAYMEIPKSKKKALLKLTKDLIKANKEMMADPEFCKVPPEELAKKIVESTKEYHTNKIEKSNFFETIESKYPEV